MIRTLFNVGQYLITLTVVRLVFAALAPEHRMLDPATQLGSTDVLPALAAGRQLPDPEQRPGRRGDRDGLRPRLAGRPCGRTSGPAGWRSPILLALAPVTAVVADFPRSCSRCCVLPLLGVQRTAWIAASASTTRCTTA